MIEVRRERDVAGDILKGLIAGAAATWVMGKATSYLYEQQDERARQEEQQARGGKSAYGIAAEKAAAALREDLSEDERKRYGSAIHWLLGAGTGAAYGVLRHRLPGADLAGGCSSAVRVGR